MDNGTKSLFIKIAVMVLTALATYLHANVPEAQLYAFATDILDVGTLLYGWYRSYGTKLVPHNSVAIDAGNVVNKNAATVVGSTALVTSSDSNPTTVPVKVVG